VTANRWAELGLADFTAPLDVGVHAADREHGTGQQGVLCHTMINFV
jgi:hypothetical protein